jgi:DNA-binding MarR family transcriptional regulator
MSLSHNRRIEGLRSEAAALVAGCPAWNARLAGRRIGHSIDRDLAPLGLGAGQVGLMALIASAADDTLGALARRSGLDPSTLSRNLRTLERAGLVEIARTGADQRRRAVWLTETGVRRLETALPVWRAAQLQLSAQLLELAQRLARESDALAQD